MACKWLLATACFALQASAKTVRSPTPPMGWNSYNAWNYNPTEARVKQSAQGLVDLGLAKLGYTSVTTDCGWQTRNRDADGRQQWNTTLFPSGGKAHGDFLHGLGLDFGLYSGAGYFQCGSTDLPASLRSGKVDAETFAAWGRDSLKYDNCYSTSRTTMVDGDSAEAQSSARSQAMAAELNARMGFEIDNTWRVSNDICNAWRSIWRIMNQVVPYFRHTTFGTFADMDMLIVGLNALSAQEERFHFGMRAINKSPLIIGATLDMSGFSKTALSILANKEIVAINQDSLAKQAQLVRRCTVEEWDIWLGELSGSRKFLCVVNWKNNTQSAEFDLASLGIASAKARDLWVATEVGAVSGAQKLTLAGHELRLWVLSDLVTATLLESTAYYSAAKAAINGSAKVTTCAANMCLPTGSKVVNIVSDAKVTFSNVSAQTAGKRVVGVDFAHYDYAFGTAWGQGDNTRNMTIAVNGGAAKRWASLFQVAIGRRVAGLLSKLMALYGAQRTKSSSRALRPTMSLALSALSC